MVENQTLTADSRKYGKVYKQHTADILKVWGEFNDAVFSQDREIPLKYLELIALGVAFTTQCEFCIEGHTANAVNAGATDTEIAEAAWVAAALRAGGAFTHGRVAFQLADDHRHQH
ncbi:MAG TPA: carboxymuconolactone decarboxylase family protein [Enteractinococcus helveticum]|uniref:Carboxymuconolactone decarboxylase family protein n=1 Tax=Enteractinococcus helveticum TaxID=1837282 RepID=A0A921FR28_9MICC|nr:carboxymuconolactone decarboxylase family protein [Enteractinococcus helveticum]HJF15386.1 carboxymuconolactone decarboxylase family protein [Enteractinococcus helveticum]